ncbi:MAG: cupin domain-containing protein [Kofleriaceae bacterium]
MTDRRHPNVINKDEVPVMEMGQGSFKVRGRRFGPHAGNVQLGGQLLELLPGEKAFPLHFHCANEEAVFVVSGTGTVRIGDARVPVRAGDWIAHPVGPEHAHQLINDGSEPLVYLAISTQHKCEVVGYPDSKKVAMSAGPSWQNPWVRQIHRMGESLGYYDDEPDAQ